MAAYTQSKINLATPRYGGFQDKNIHPNFIHPLRDYCIIDSLMLVTHTSHLVGTGPMIEQGKTYNSE